MERGGKTRWIVARDLSNELWMKISQSGRKKGGKRGECL
jgi:hypothetical protein